MVLELYAIVILSYHRYKSSVLIIWEDYILILLKLSSFISRLTIIISKIAKLSIRNIEKIIYILLNINNLK